MGCFNGQKGKIIGIGELVLDIVFVDGQPRAAVPGGSVFNSMVSLGRTAGVAHPEIPIMMISQIGEDKVAEIVTSFMDRNHVDGQLLRKIPHTQTTVSMALLNSSGDASYEFFRDGKAPAFEAPEIEFSADDIILFGSFFAVDDATREETRKIIKAARKAGATVYYDINFRKNHLLQLPKLISEIEENCRLASIVRGSSEDIACIYGIENGSDAYEQKIKALCPQFIYTRGCEPAEVFWNGVHGRYEVEKVPVVSTIGAGDNFNAGFIRAILEEQDAHQLSADALERAVTTALSFSAAVCQSMDNYVPENFGLRGMK